MVEQQGREAIKDAIMAEFTSTIANAANMKLVKEDKNAEL